ncbi:hypothetical protein HOY82DRAFT_539695 [Tuber indicum]|nr:hypothetical protein HOY82DRAFT_539695 [Tuber indicum]
MSASVQSSYQLGEYDSAGSSSGKCYNKGIKIPFWSKIRALLKAEIDKDLKNPDITIWQLKESRTVQRDTELDHNLDLWIERENELLHQQEDAKKPKEVLQKEAVQAAIHWDNLLLLHSHRCYYSSDSSDSGNDGTEVILSTADRSSHDSLRNDNQNRTPPISDTWE